MAIQERALDVDAVWELARLPEYDGRRLYLIDGELRTMSPVQRKHGNLASLLNYYLQGFVLERDLGEVHTEVGYYIPGDRSTLLAPDLSFVSRARIAGQPEDGFVPLMPDLAVEIASPYDTLSQIRRKAAIYLANGASLVWIVLPTAKGVDVCRSANGARLDIEFVAQSETLSGEDALPGYRLELARLFPIAASNPPAGVSSED